MRTLLILAILVATPVGAAAQDIYRWVDENGIVHYSDQPREADAEAVEIDVPPGISDPTRNYFGPNAGTQDDAEPVSLGAAPTVDSADYYRDAEIQSPQPQQVLWNIVTRLPVDVVVTPALKASDRVQFLLDGQPIGEPIGGTSTIVQPVYRGQHTIAAAIVSPNGEIVFQGPAVEFFVQQSSRAR